MSGPAFSIATTTSPCFNIRACTDPLMDPPTLHELSVYAQDAFDLSRENDKLLHKAADLGSEQNTLAYHGTHHYPMVAREGMRLIAKHNEIYTGTDLGLNEDDITDLIIACYLHDYQHDGRGNTIDGTHIPGRLEKLACDEGLPQMIEAGLSQDRAERIKRYILATDVTPMGSDQAPAKVIMRAYDQTINQADVEADLTDTPFAGMSPKEIAMAALLHCADIAPSITRRYDQNMATSQSLAEETGIEAIATPEATLGFAGGLGSHLLIPKAARALYEEPLTRFKSELTQEIKAGDAPRSAPG